MTICNRTAHTIIVHGRDVNPTELKPDQTMEMLRRMSDTIGIHSDVGSCIISFVYGKENHQSFGLKIKDDGKNINVFDGD